LNLLERNLGKEKALSSSRRRKKSIGAANSASKTDKVLQQHIRSRVQEKKATAFSQHLLITVDLNHIVLRILSECHGSARLKDKYRVNEFIQNKYGTAENIADVLSIVDENVNKEDKEEKITDIQSEV